MDTWIQVMERARFNSRKNIISMQLALARAAYLRRGGAVIEGMWYGWNSSIWNQAANERLFQAGLMEKQIVGANTYYRISLRGLASFLAPKPEFDAMIERLAEMTWPKKTLPTGNIFDTYAYNEVS